MKVDLKAEPEVGTESNPKPDAEIREILDNEAFFDSSDIELSDDDDIYDKTYHPGSNDQNVELQDDNDDVEDGEDDPEGEAAIDNADDTDKDDKCEDTKCGIGTCVKIRMTELVDFQ